MSSKELFPGLPDEFLDDFNDSKIEINSKIELLIERRKYGKFWAVLSGIDLEKEKLKELLKKIKRSMSCGGTLKNKNLEILFGKSEKINKLISILEEEGINKEMIFITKKFK